MVIDSSAILAIAFQEPEARRMAGAISHAPRRLMSAVNWLETLIVAESRHGGESADATLLLMRDLDIEALPFDLEADVRGPRCLAALRKGRHPAALNLGDCCAYAVAITSGEPLLYKGEDFQKTDVNQAQW